MHLAQMQVEQFHLKYGVPVLRTPVIPGEKRAKLRIDLIEEELREFKEASAEKDIVAIADALGDLLYVVYGAALEYGLDMKPIFDEIHRSNLSKLGADGKPMHAENGKIIKGPNYTPPDLKSVVERLRR